MDWKDIEGYEGLYRISDTGIVQSYDKLVNINGGLRLHKGKVKAIYTEKGIMKYRSVSLSNNGIGKTYRIHRLVAKAFIANPNNYANVLHNDNDTSNNSVSNLRWGTQKDNLQQMARENRWSNQYYISLVK